MGLLSGITLAGGETANVTIELNVAAERNRITVTGVVGEIRTDEPQLGDLLTATQMEETPLPDRKITYLPLLNAANRPAINQGDVFMNENLFTTNGAGAPGMVRGGWRERNRHVGTANHLQQYPACGGAGNGRAHKRILGGIRRQHG